MFEIGGVVLFNPVMRFLCICIYFKFCCEVQISNIPYWTLPICSTLHALTLTRFLNASVKSWRRTRGWNSKIFSLNALWTASCPLLVLMVLKFQNFSYIHLKFQCLANTVHSLSFDGCLKYFCQRYPLSARVTSFRA